MFTNVKVRLSGFWKMDLINTQRDKKTCSYNRQLIKRQKENKRGKEREDDDNKSNEGKGIKWDFPCSGIIKTSSLGRTKRRKILFTCNKIYFSCLCDFVNSKSQDEEKIKGPDLIQIKSCQRVPQMSMSFV